MMIIFNMLASILGESNILTIFFTLMWFIVLFDSPFILAYTTTTNIITWAEDTYQLFLHHHPNFPADPLLLCPPLAQLRDHLKALYARTRDSYHVKESMKRRKAVTELCVIVLLIRAMFFLFGIWRSCGEESEVGSETGYWKVDFWGGDIQNVRPVHIPPEWLSQQ